MYLLFRSQEEPLVPTVELIDAQDLEGALRFWGRGEVGEFRWRSVEYQRRSSIKEDFHSPAK